MRELPSASKNPPLLDFSIRAQQVALTEVVRHARENGRSIDDFCFRVGVKTGGCNGFAYFVDIDRADDKDYIFDIGQLRIAVDYQSKPYLERTRVDYVDSAMEKKFVFDNPNASGACGCGWSVDF